MRMMNKSMMLFTLIFLIPFVVAVDVSVESKNVEKGSEVTLDILVDSIDEVFGGQMDISYDPEILGFVRVESGGYLDQDGEGNSIDSNSLGGVVSDNGRISKYVVLNGLGSTSGVSGSGVWAKITFEGKEIGTSDVVVSDTLWSDVDAQKIEGVSVSNAKVVVSADYFSGYKSFSYIFLVVLLVLVVFVVFYFKTRQS